MKSYITLVDIIDSVQNSNPICHICLKSCKSVDGLKIHFWVHEGEQLLIWMSEL